MAMSQSKKRSFCNELDFNKEIDRLQSLVEWRTTDYLDVYEAACSGCYYDNETKRITCYFCGRVFIITREAYTNHILDGKPECPLINKTASTNVPISKWAFEYQMWKFQQNRMFRYAKCAGFVSNISVRLATLQNHPKISNRLTSELCKKIKDAAEAGFYYDEACCIDEENDIICPCCDLPLGHSAYNSALEYHVSRSLFRCEFLIIIQGIRNINKTVEDMYAKYRSPNMTPTTRELISLFRTPIDPPSTCNTNDATNISEGETALEMLANSAILDDDTLCGCAYLIPHKERSYTCPMYDILPREKLMMLLSDTISMEWVLSWGVVIAEKYDKIKRYAKHKDFAVPFLRRETFIVNKTLYTVEDITIMADNGIFHQNGRLVCYCCDWIWEGSDLSLLPVEHMTQSSICYFANYYYGLLNIQSTLANLVTEERLERQRIIEDATNSMPPPPTKNSIESVCKICMTNPSNVICIPCGHVCLCKMCHFKYTEGEDEGAACIICRKTVRQYNCCYF